MNSTMLIASRGLQGLGAALVAPNALALIATTFPVGGPRNRAMGVYGAMSALGITVGVLLGGLLTGLLSWRWVFFINVPIGLAVLAGTTALVEGGRTTGRLDTTDALSGTGAMFALAYGITRGGHVLPAVFLTSLGLGLAAVAMPLTAVHGVPEARAGVASALVNMAQQIGAALGLALFTTISLTAAEGRMPGAVKALQGAVPASGPAALAQASEALSHGYTTAFLSGAVMLLIAAVIVLVAVTTRRTQAAAGAHA